jgi:membrane-associated phospholipid phosphatase
MKVFSHFISYLLHPLFIPIGGTLAYFLITPKYTPLEIQSASILPIFILTVIIPLVAYLILKNLGLVHSISLETVKERKYPLYMYATILLLILYNVIPNSYVSELYFYFAGLLGATLACILLLTFNFKTSLHTVGVSGLLMYLINLSIHFEINLIIAISVFIFFTGSIITARLYLKAHTITELIIGLFIGLLSQLLTVRFWL